jgi:predicted ABC-type ATPase
LQRTEPGLQATWKAADSWPPEGSQPRRRSECLRSPEIDPRGLRSPALLILLAGPNGSGKTTFFEEYLQELGLPFVNADRFARVLRDAEPGASSDQIDRRAFDEAEGMRAALVEAGLSFCTETVFSDPIGAKLRFLEDARSRGFAVFMVFILGGPGQASSRARRAD